MKVVRKLIGAALFLFIVGNFHAGYAIEKTVDQTLKEFTRLDSATLILKLMEPSSRSEAFYELLRRSDPDIEAEYSSFLKTHHSPEVVVCPQPDDKPPIYLVYYGSKNNEDREDWEFRNFSLSDTNYMVENPYELFKPDTKGKPISNWGASIVFFSSDGALLKPFEDKNYLHASEVLGDINDDGFIELAWSRDFSFDDLDSVHVLQISVVEEKARPVFSVLYNWGTDEWSYKLTDIDNDGIFDIELGPVTGAGIKSKVSYRWNPDTRSYDGPRGEKEGHFRVIDGANVLGSLQQLKEQKVQFPADPDFVDTNSIDDEPWSRQGLKRPLPSEMSRPYSYRSLRNLTNEELIKYIGRGKEMYELEWDTRLKTHTPKNFWKMDPKTAALKMAHINRYPDNQWEYLLAIDDRDGQIPPDICSIAFSYLPSNYGEHFFLRIHPENSYLAYAGRLRSGFAFYNIARNWPAYDFRYINLTYEDARHIAHTIWWLNRVRSYEIASDGWSMTSFGSHCFESLTLITEVGSKEIDIGEFTPYYNYASQLWYEYYTPTECLNLAGFLIKGFLQEHLGDAWSNLGPRHSLETAYLKSGPVKYEPEEIVRLEKMAAKFLDLFTLDQSLISYDIIHEAADYAGNKNYSQLKSRLDNILKKLPELEKPKIPSDEDKSEIDIDEYEYRERNPKHLCEEDRFLYEIKLLQNDLDLSDAGYLRTYILLNLKKLSSVNDLQTLKCWACSEYPDSKWALQRLKSVDKNEYVSSLEWWLRNTEEMWRIQEFFDEIIKVDKKRAAGIARNLLDDQNGKLAVLSFAFLSETNDIREEKKLVKAMIELMLDPMQEWEVRKHVIDALVPHNNPLRYSTEDIDLALLRLLNPEDKASLSLNTSEPGDHRGDILGSACRALAGRGRTKLFDQMASRLENIKDCSAYYEILGALAHLSQADPEKFNKKLFKILSPYLTKKNKMRTDIIWAIWSADLREFKPVLEEIATSGPDDYQDGETGCLEDSKPIDGRLHMARKVVSIWNEEDIVTRVKLLIGMGMYSLNTYYDNPEPERTNRVKIELQKLGTELTKGAREELRAFLEYCDKQSFDTEFTGLTPQRKADFIDMVRKVLDL